MLTIANCALDHLGQSPLAHSGDKSKTADLVRRNMDKACEYVLRRCLWSELTLTACPSQIEVCDPCCDFPEGFCFAFALPDDYIRMYDVEVKAEDDWCPREKVQWKVQKVRTNNGNCTALITDHCPVRIEYICKPTDLEGLPGDLQELIALRLAIVLAPFLKADKTLKRELTAEFQTFLDDAGAVSDGHDAECLSIPNGFLLRPRIGDGRAI